MVVRIPRMKESPLGARALTLAALLAVLVIPSGAESQNATLRLRPPVRNCPVCDLWLRYENVVLRSQQEVGALRQGVFYFYHASDPSVIEPLIRFAHERDELEAALRADPARRRLLGEACGHRAHVTLGIDLELSTSARGILALLTARNRMTLDELRSEAGLAVRGKIPVWF